MSDSAEGGSSGSGLFSSSSSSKVSYVRSSLAPNSNSTYSACPSFVPLDIKPAGKPIRVKTSGELSSLRSKFEPATSPETEGQQPGAGLLCHDEGSIGLSDGGHGQKISDQV